MPRLDFFVEYKIFLRVSLGSESLLIGRGGDCDVQLAGGDVSRSHARIGSDDQGGYWIENLSANGTRLNSAMLEERTSLSPGDRVYIAEYVMVYHPEDAPPLKAEDDTTMISD